MKNIFKYVIVWTFYIVAIILCIGGVTAILGIPLGLVGMALQKQFKIHID